MLGQFLRHTGARRLVRSGAVSDYPTFSRNTLRDFAQMPFNFAGGDANRARQLFVRLAPGLRVAGVNKNYGLAAIHPSHHLFGGYSVHRFLFSRISHVFLLMNKTYRAHRTYRVPISPTGPISPIRTMAIFISRPCAIQNAPARPFAAYKRRHAESLRSVV